MAVRLERATCGGLCGVAFEESNKRAQIDIRHHCNVLGSSKSGVGDSDWAW